MRRIICCFLSCVLVLAGCGSASSGSVAQETKQYTATFLTLFDTVTSIVGRAESEEAFQAVAQDAHDRLEEYHQLFDIYHDYEGINNLKTVNDQAGIAPVPVDAKILDLLRDCKEYYVYTDGKVNAAMGSVLSLWHDARNDGINNPAAAALPDPDALELAAAHMDFDAVELNEEASTVYISDPDMRLDVGAIAKGWSVQRVAEESPSGLLISVGGNVCATGPKLEDGTPWVVGIQDFDGSSDYLHTIYVTDGCVVTSGDYQRTYVVDGETYHHIIDPDTLYPSRYWHSVTIVCEDSGVADMLSTALFLLPMEEGQKLLDQFGAEAVWADLDGKLHYSPGFQALIRT